MAVSALLSHGKVKLHAAAWKALAGEGNDSAGRGRRLGC